MDLSSYAMQGLRNGGSSPAPKSSDADRAFRIGTIFRNVGYRGTLKATTGRGHRINVDAGGTRHIFDFARNEDNPMVLGISGPGRP